MPALIESSSGSPEKIPAGLLSERLPVVVWVLAWSAVAVALVLVAVAGGRPATWVDAAAAAALATAAGVHGWWSARSERTRRHGAAAIHLDPTATWDLAAALVLPPLLCLPVVAAIRLARLRTVRRRDHRYAFSTVAHLFGVTVAAAVAEALTPAAALPLSAAGLLGTVAAVVVHRVAQTITVGGAVALAAEGLPKMAAVLGSRGQNLADALCVALGLVLAQALADPVDLAAPAAVLAAVTAAVAALTGRAAELARLRHGVHHDPLTGLLNVSGWRAASSREAARAQRTGQPLCVAVVDVDHFKKVNDTHGHAAGDAVLQAVAAAVQAAVRRVDVVARVGGEELALLLPGLDAPAAARVAERVRQAVAVLAVAARDLAGQSVTVAVTCSIGVATTPAGPLDLDSVRARADAALYTAKKSGRNRVVVSDPDSALKSQPPD